MKNGKLLKCSGLFFAISLLFCSSYKSRFSVKEIRKMESEALFGNFETAMKLSDYNRIDLQDTATQMFWNCICFESSLIEGSWNFVNINFMEDGKSVRYQYLIFVCEQYMKELESDSFIIQAYEKFHREFSSDNIEATVNIADENYQYFHGKAFSGSGLAALKIAQFYEKQSIQNSYIEYKRLLDIGCKYNPAEEKLPLFWYRIGAQNGSKECMKEYAELLKQSSDKYDNIRAEFWEKKAK